MIVLLKNKGKPRDAYADELGRRAVEHCFFPLLDHRMVDPDGLKQYLQSDEFSKIDATIVTSQRAVEAINHQLPQLTQPSMVTSKPTFTVGPATAKVLTAAGYTDVRGANNAGNGDRLADIIQEEYHADNNLFRFVFFTGVTRRDIIPVRLHQMSGVHLTERVVYKTEELPNIHSEFQKLMQQTDDDVTSPWIVFFSPASAGSILQVLHCIPRHKYRLAAIGPTTRDYLARNNLTIDLMAEKPDADHLISALCAKR
jgi:uroporphyrinogen-III synthase